MDSIACERCTITNHTLCGTEFEQCDKYLPSDRPRPQLTIGEVIDFMSEYPRNALVSAALSEVNVDEPVETQEFIMEEESTPVVAISYSNSTQLTIGCIDNRRCDCGRQLSPGKCPVCDNEE